jgi:trehalose synthase
MYEVSIDPVPLERMEPLLSTDRTERLRRYAHRARGLLAGRTVWNISSTAQGGGVAEMLQALLAYGRGAGVDTRWLVLTGDPDFFAITKRLHNLLHGSAGDRGPLGPDERRHYTAVTAENAAEACLLVRPGDIVLAHDPQSAGMVAALRERGAHVAWRCHVGSGLVTEETERGWEFLREFIEPADAFIFSRPQYPPSWLPGDRIRIIAPSIDPFSAKNVHLHPADVAASLRQAGIVDLPGDGSLLFRRREGSTGEVRPHRGLIDGDGPIPGDVRVVMQLSRWDRLKDMTGVLAGFATYLHTLPDDVHLLLAGPEVAGVTDDPEGAGELESCRALWRHLPAPVQDRVHLCCLPMDDVDENAHLANALQRHATVVVQKSLAEGFGLTVTEPMWKSKPVVASAVGGIQDQIEDGISGFLLRDPHDTELMMAVLGRLLTDPGLAATVGAAARERVREHFLGDRHLIQFVQLFDALLTSDRDVRPLRT